MFQHLRKPDFERLRTALACGVPDAVPLIELGIHPAIKAAILGRPLTTVRDEIEFMRGMGYDFVKLQPRINFQITHTNAPTKAASGVAAVQVPPDRAWASEGVGIITNWEDFERYPWPKASDIDYSRFEEAAKSLPEGMGVIGQYGDIFTLAWEA